MIKEDEFKAYNKVIMFGEVTNVMCWYCRKSIDRLEKLFWIGQRDETHIDFSTRLPANTVNRMLYFHEACFCEIAGQAYIIKTQ